MKKFLPLVLLFSTAGCMKAECDDARSHSFFSVQPHYALGSFEQLSLFRNKRMSTREDGYGAAFELAAFGGRSEDPCRLGAYFLPFGKNKLVIKENALPNPLDGTTTRDVDAEHLNIQTVDGTFHSELTFMPRHEFFGVGLSWKQSLKDYEDGNSKFFFEVNAPLVCVKNNMHMCENVINDGGGVAMDDDVVVTGLDNSPRVANATAAFNQSNWNFGRILTCPGKSDSCCDSDSCCSNDCSNSSCCSSDESNSTSCASCNECENCKSSCSSHPYKRTRISDIEIKLGMNSVLTGCCRIDEFVGIIIPTGNRPSGRYVFEAVVGNNHHFGLMWGANIEMTISRKDNHVFKYALDAVSRYLLPNHQFRSFDLYGKPWSRYMEMYSNQAQANTADTEQNDQMGTSGINLMTQCARVSPRFSTVIDNTFLYEHCNLNVELGWGFHARHGEKVEPCYSALSALKYYTGAGETTLYRTINGLAEGTEITAANYNNGLILAENIDPQSAAHPAVINHTLHGALGYNWNTRCYPMFVGLGGCYDFSANNTSLHQWTLFGKVGITF